MNMKFSRDTRIDEMLIDTLFSGVKHLMMRSQKDEREAARLKSRIEADVAWLERQSNNAVHSEVNGRRVLIGYRILVCCTLRMQVIPHEPGHLIETDYSDFIERQPPEMRPALALYIMAMLIAQHCGVPCADRQFELIYSAIQLAILGHNPKTLVKHFMVGWCKAYGCPPAARLYFHGQPCGTAPASETHRMHVAPKHLM